MKKEFKKIIRKYRHIDRSDLRMLSEDEIE